MVRCWACLAGFFTRSSSPMMTGIVCHTTGKKCDNHDDISRANDVLGLISMEKNDTNLVI